MTKENLKEKKVTELHKIASDMKISGYKSYKKDELIDVILKEINLKGETKISANEVVVLKSKRRNPMTW
tara:strand:+ start:132 stop:338 length:207 start_codon:yes stop_codon:yes gene_type:complete